MSGVPGHWIAHRRADGELVGWIDMTSAAPDLIPVDRLGRPMPAVADWIAAEERIEEIGLGFLTGAFGYRGRRVRIRTVDDEHIVVTTALTDAVGDLGEEYVLPFPAGDELTEAPD